MADWTTIADSQLDPDAPLTSELAYAWRDNPIAIAEGAPGAPRVQPAGYQAKIFESQLSVSTPVTVTNLDTSTLLEIFFFMAKLAPNGTLDFQWRASSDNGATFGAWSSLSLNAPVMSGTGAQTAANASPIIRLSDGALFSVATASGQPDKFTSFYPTNAMSFRVLESGSVFAGARVVVLSRGRG